MFKSIKKLFSGSEFGDFTGEEQEVLVSLLVLVEYADMGVQEDEEKNIDEVVRGLDWKPDTPADEFVDRAVKHAVNICEDEEEIGSFIHSLAEKISDSDSAQAIYNACVRLAMADRDLDPGESTVLSILSAEFDLQ